jgi:hypothetical protein
MVTRALAGRLPLGAALEIELTTGESPSSFKFKISVQGKPD